MKYFLKTALMASIISFVLLSSGIHSGDTAVLFEDDFSAGFLDQWTIISSKEGNVTVEYGELSCNGIWANATSPTSLLINDFELEYDMKIISNSGTTETYFRSDNITSIIPRGYMFSFREDSSTIALYKRTTTWTLLQVSSFFYTLNTWYRVKNYSCRKLNSSIYQWDKVYRCQRFHIYDRKTKIRVLGRS